MTDPKVRVGGPGRNTPASSGCSRIADTASSEASASRRSSRSTGADVRAALSAWKLLCPARSGARAAEVGQGGGEGGGVPHELTAVIGKARGAAHVGARCGLGPLRHCGNFAGADGGGATHRDDVAEEARPTKARPSRHFVALALSLWCRGVSNSMRRVLSSRSPCGHRFIGRERGMGCAPLSRSTCSSKAGARSGGRPEGGPASTSAYSPRPAPQQSPEGP